MNNKKAKELRRDANLIAKETFHKDIFGLRFKRGQYKWGRYSPKAIYKGIKESI